MYYILARELLEKQPQQVLRHLGRILQVTPVDSFVIHGALANSWPDLEESFVHLSARPATTHIVTRNAKDFLKAALVVCDANTFWAALA